MARARIESDVKLRRLDGSAPEILAGARVLVGALFAYDGVQKLLHVLGGMPEGGPAAIVPIAGAVELFGGALMAQGLFKRAAAPRLTKVSFRNDDGGCHISPVRLSLTMGDGMQTAGSGAGTADPMAGRQCIGNGVGKRA